MKIKQLLPGAALFLFLPLMAGSLPAVSQEDETDVGAENILRCARLAKAKDRHTCIDALAFLLAKEKAATGASGTADISTKPARAKIAGKAEEDQETAGFGAEQLQAKQQGKPEAKAEPRLVSLVTRTRVNPSNIVTYYLENGQVWRQTEGVWAGNLKAPFNVEIKKGTLSGYRLRVDGEKHFVRVRRIK